MNEASTTDIGAFDWTQLLQLLQEKGIALGINFGVKLVTALAIFFIGKFAIRLAVGGISKFMRRQNVDETLQTFICNLTSSALLVVVIIAAIGALGIETTSFIAIFGAAGLAVGLALQGSLSNFASGVLIILFRPYRVGDYVEAAGIAGSVVQVQILTTILKTGDNIQIIVPNSQIMNSIITNYSANDTRRIDMVIGVSYADDLDKVRQTLESVLAAEDRVLDEPKPTIAVSELADSSVNFVVRPWAKTSDYSSVKCDLTEAIKKRFDQEGISFPFPQQDVHLYKET
ncbi:MAG: mechanosensitive ion channel [Proteobacteria bacterium]|nr:mechanosensitive ion channel [Pseudomonadota bacterium]